MPEQPRPKPDYETLAVFSGIMARTFTMQEQDHWSEIFSQAQRTGKCPQEYED